MTNLSTYGLKQQRPATAVASLWRMELTNQLTGAKLSNSKVIDSLTSYSVRLDNRCIFINDHPPEQEVQ